MIILLEMPPSADTGKLLVTSCPETIFTAKHGSWEEILEKRNTRAVNDPSKDRKLGAECNPVKFTKTTRDSAQ